MIWNETELDGSIDVLQVTSEELEGNPLDDPITRDLYVYLPPEYEESDQRFPVLYILSGFGSSSKKYLSHSTFDPAIHHQFEHVRKEGGGQPAILVFPDCKTSLGGSQYMDSSAVGNYRSYLTKDIVPLVDDEYRTKTEPEFRGVFGKSSGGYGALRLAMKDTELFRVVGCHSGDMYFPYCYLPDLPKAAESIRQAGSKEEWLENYLNDDFKSGSDFPTWNIIAMSACYSPDPKKPGAYELPFDLETGKLRERIWEKWLDEDPVEMVKTFGGRLRELKYLFFDCGTHDEFNLQIGARILHRRLEQQNIDHEFEEFDGGHRKTTARYPLFLRKLTDAFPS